MKHQLCICVVLIFAVCNIAYAQLFVKQEKNIGGSGNDDFTCMVKTPDGGILMGGSSNSDKSRQKSENSRGFNDYWIVKLDSKGRYEWDKTIGGSGYDDLKAIGSTSNGGYILCGTSNSPVSGEKSENSYGFADYWIVKLDANRKVEWDKTIGGDYIDDATSIITTIDGGYLAGGTSVSTESGNKTAPYFGSNDYWMVKLDGSGNIQWDKSYGGTESDLLTNLIQTVDGDYILAGFSYSSRSGNKTQINRGADDYWIIKTDASGVIKWNTTVGGDSWDETCDVAEGRNGSIFVGGSSRSNASGDKTQDNHDINQNGNDYWIVKLNSNGKKIYDKTVGGPGEDHMSGFFQNVNGIVLYGYSNSWAGDKSDSAIGTWVVALDNTQQITWDATLPVYDPERAVVFGNNHYALGGNYGSFQKYDFHIADVRYNDSTNLQTTAGNAKMHALINQKNAFSFTMYPNPASRMVHIQSSSKATFEIIDLHGRVLLSRTIAGSGDIGLDNIPSGTYFIRTNTSNTIQKLIVAK